VCSLCGHRPPVPSVRRGTLRGAGLSTASGDFERQVEIPRGAVSQLNTDGRETEAGNGQWIAFTTAVRPYQVLDNRTPMAVWRDAVTGALGDTAVDMTLRLDNARALPAYQ
jgi:hypothetical protein